MVRPLSIAGPTKPMTTSVNVVEGQLFLRQIEENNLLPIVSVNEIGKFERSHTLLGTGILLSSFPFHRRDRDRERGRDRERDRPPVVGAYSRPPPPPLLGATNYNPHADSRDRDRERDRWMGVPREERYTTDRFVFHQPSEFVTH